MSFQPKDSALCLRALESQKVTFLADLDAGTTSLTAHVAITVVVTPEDTGPPLVPRSVATNIVLDIGSELVSKVQRVIIRNRTTGAVVPILTVPDISVAHKISVDCDGTDVTDAVVEIIFIVA